MYNVKRLTLILIIFIFCFSSVFADSNTFDTIIISVSNGVNDFGLNLFPVGTRWRYTTSSKLFNCFDYDTDITFDFNFALNNNYMDYRFAWDSGKPLWSISQSEWDGNKYKGITYFNPRSNIYVQLSQGFGLNELEGSGPGYMLSLKFNTRYAMALEQLGVAPNTDNLVFMSPEGVPIAPFGPDSVIPAHPWLQDTRTVFNNRLEFDFDIYQYDYLGFNSSDGITANVHFEFGPYWLANTFFIEGITSDYWNISSSLYLNLNLFHSQQSNGLNWFSINLGHSDTLSYTGGKVVPDDRMPRDRFRGALYDSLWLIFTGPQFIAWDCYSEFRVSLNNNLYWGHVANEVSQESFGLELMSSIDAFLHIRLFGFMHFGYGFGYEFASGIWDRSPGWYQEASLRFYISL